MDEEKVLVVGLGEVGLPLYKLLRECDKFLVYGLDINEARMSSIEQKGVPDKVDIMHICIPCFNQDEFANLVVGYAKRFKPKLLIINSTVPPETTQKIHELGSCLVAHSPVRGMHKSLEHMKWELKRWTKYVGGVNVKAGEAALRHFRTAGFKPKVLKSCAETELAKLFETTYRAWMIACFQEMHRISKRFGADFDDMVDFLDDTHRVRFDRPVMFPGVIGGHCLIPNTKLLLKNYDSKFLRLILESNEKRKEEIKDEDVRRELEKIKEKVEALERELMERFGEGS
ncbi:GDP-mannose dehydrogenase [Candidatus Bathyarchaeota archaeon]|nr:GDP-mannose dehydrogenase [Candidatus Bathyarchaeota archaeon]